ncbi:MAG: hypothetical protein ACI9LT_002031 [Pseudoalteromonas distincta]|jgi:hypothetical protein
MNVPEWFREVGDAGRMLSDGEGFEQPTPGGPSRCVAKQILQESPKLTDTFETSTTEEVRRMSAIVVIGMILLGFAFLALITGWASEMRDPLGLTLNVASQEGSTGRNGRRWKARHRASA